MTRNQQQVMDHISEVLDAGINEALQQLADAGLGPFYGVKFLRTKLGIPVGEAKKRVHHSGVWRHLDGSIEELHDSLEKALNEVSREMTNDK